MFINSRTPPEVTVAKIAVDQRRKELRLFDDALKLAQRAERRGLAKTRIVRAINLLAKALEKAGESGGT